MTDVDETDPRVSTDDDGFECFDGTDSQAVEDTLAEDSFREECADREAEH